MLNNIKDLFLNRKTSKPTVVQAAFNQKFSIFANAMATLARVLKGDEFWRY